MFGLIKDNITVQDIVNIKTLGKEVVVYTNMIPKIDKCPVCIVQQSFAYIHKGALIATNITEAGKMINCFGSSHKIFYSTDREWCKTPNLQYETIKSIYQNPSLILAVSSKEERDIYEKVFNRRVEVLPSLKTLRGLL